MTDKTIDQLTLLIATTGADVPASKTNTDYRIRVGEANGLATLDASGLVPTAQLPPPSSAAWGGITGTVSDQTDLWVELGSKAELLHLHGTDDITNLDVYTGFDSRYFTEAEVTASLALKASLNADVTFGHVTASKGGSGVASTFYMGTGGTHFIQRTTGNNISIGGGTTLGYNGNTVWHSGNDGDGSGLAADTVDGYHAATGVGAGNTIPVRAAAGYLYSNYFNMTANVTSTAPTHIPVETGSDEFLRWQTPTDFISNLDLAVRTPTIQSATTGGSINPATTTDQYVLTAQASGLTINNPTGTWVQGQGLVIRIKDNGVARAITWGAGYRGIGVTLPTTTTASKTKYIGIIYNATDAKWDVVSVATEA